MLDDPHAGPDWQEYRRHDARLMELRQADWLGVHVELITRDADGACEARMRVRQHMVCLLCEGGRAGFINGIAEAPPRRVAQEPGWIRIVPAGQPIWSRWTRGRRTYLLVLIAPETLTALSGQKVSLRPQMNLRDERLRRVLDDMCRELAAPDLFSPVLGEALARQLAAMLARMALGQAAQMAVRRGGLGPRNLRAVMALIERRSTGKLSVAELATEAGLSTHHFCHAFRQSTGLPPHRYLLKHRLAKARTLLEDSSLSLSEIAHKVGFGGSSHFSTAFRRATGVSPSAWRRRI